MAREVLGPGATIVGVDIDPAAKEHEAPGIRVLIGDQGDPGFWRHFREEVPQLDVLIDDGSHKPEHQRATLELLPHLRPGGVLIVQKRPESN